MFWKHSQFCFKHILWLSSVIIILFVLSCVKKWKNKLSEDVYENLSNYNSCAYIFHCSQKSVRYQYLLFTNCLVHVNYLVSAVFVRLKLFVLFKQSALKKVRAVCLIFFETRYLNLYLISVHKLDILINKQKLAI